MRNCGISLSATPLFRTLTLAFAVAGIGSAQNVVTQHYDTARTGQNVNETILTPRNVNTNTFGKLFSIPVDGAVYAQPLYMGNLTISGRGQHKVVFVATEHDSVYAFDADTNGGANAIPLWKITLLDAAHGAAAGAAPESSADLSNGDIQAEIGITATPVIDPNTGTMYVVGETVENDVVVQRLHALSVTTGAEKFGGPVVLKASVPGTGNGSSGGVLNFDPKWENNRAGLLLLNGIVYLGFGSHGDNGPWHGWILAYNAATLAQTGVFCTTANGIGSGIWMSGAGLAADVMDPAHAPFGRMFVATGNGSYDATLPYTNSMSYGDGQLRLDLTNGVPRVTDAFTPYNQQSLNASDSDLASGGVLLLPDQTTGGHVHLLVQVGKQGTIYLVDRDHMGDYGAADIIVQEITHQTKGLWSMPAYWNNNVYLWGSGDQLKVFSLANGLLSNTPTSVSPELSGYPGSTPVVSANGATNAIVWNVKSASYYSNTPAILLAHDATNVATTLYSSGWNAARDAPGPAEKFATPLVINGKVYVAGQGDLSVYGLLSGQQQVARPVIKPASESFAGTLSVSITDATSGAAIFYTTDGTIPTEASTRYTGLFSVSATTTVNALGSAIGYLQSSIGSATYTVATQAATPVFSPAAGTYTSAQSVVISAATANAVIHYTLDGTTPKSSSPVYSGPISVSSNVTIQALAMVPGMTNSAVATAVYSILLNGQGFNFGNGFSGAQSSISFNNSAQLNDTRLQLTDGGKIEVGSAFYKTPVYVSNFMTDFTFQLSNPVADGFTFTIQGVGPTALGLLGGNLGYGGIAKSVAVKFDLYNNSGEGSNSTGLYTNGVSPTVPAINLSNSGIDLHSGDTMSAHITYNGSVLTMTITDAIAHTTYTGSWTVNIPAWVGASQGYVGFTGGTGGSSASQKIETWTYVSIPPPPAATPVFSPAAGTYTAAQSVKISDATPSAVIHYTVDGSTPTASSRVYSAAISVSSNVTVRAIAVASGLTNSAIGTAAYSILPGGIGINFGSGFSNAQSTMAFNGSAAVNSSWLQLTNGTANQVGSAFYKTAVNVQTFTNDFTFQLANAAADGFTFVIQRNALTALGGPGGGLGYGGIGKSVALKFDIYNNAGEGNDSTGLYTNGATPILPSVDLSTSGINLASGDLIAVHMTYDGATLTATISDASVNATYTKSWPVNIPSLVGANTAYIGFTGASGGKTATQNVETWTYVGVSH